MISMVSTKNKGKQAKRKYSVKKKKKKKKTEKKGHRNMKKKCHRESNLVHLHLQQTSWPLHHSDAQNVKINVIIIKLFFSAIDVV